MNIFIAFANQDRDVRDKLLRQMNLVKDRQGWNIWSAKEIKAGEQWDVEIKNRLFDSNVVILLLSTDFFNSDYIVEKELPEVIEKHKKGDCQIIPVIARVCHWKDTAFGDYAQLGDIQALPVGEKPIMSKGHWDHEDQPYFETVEGIKESIRAFREKKEKHIAAEAARLQKEKERAEKEKAEKAAWKKAQQSNSELSWETFLQQYPDSVLVPEALKNLDALRKSQLNEQKRRDDLLQKANEAERQRQELSKKQLLVEQQRTEKERLNKERIRREAKIRQDQEQEAALSKVAEERERERQSAQNAAWAETEMRHTLEDYNKFLAAYPDSPHTREVRFRIKELRKAERKQPSWLRYALIGGVAILIGFVAWLLIFSNDDKLPRFRVSLEIQPSCNASLAVIEQLLRERAMVDTLKVGNLATDEQKHTISFDLSGHPKENDPRNTPKYLGEFLTSSPVLEFYKTYKNDDPRIYAFYTTLSLRPHYTENQGEKRPDKGKNAPKAPEEESPLPPKPTFSIEQSTTGGIARVTLTGFDSLLAVFNEPYFKELMPADCRLVRSLYPENLDNGMPGNKYTVFILKGEPLLTEKNIIELKTAFDQASNEKFVSGKFNNEGARVFAQLTKELSEVHGELAIVFDHQFVVSAPTVINPMVGGEFNITGPSSLADAKLMTPFPCKLKVRSITRLK